MRHVLRLVAFLLLVPAASAQQDEVATGNPLGLDLIGSLQNLSSPDNISSTLLVFFLLTVLTLAPAFLVMTTSFTRIIVVFGFLRQAMATQQSPPNQVLVGLALFLTFFIMAPTYREVNEEALQPYIRGELTLEEARDAGAAPVHEFMYRQIRIHNNVNELALFIEIADLELPLESAEDLPFTVLIPAYVISELKIAFIMGFVIYIPFLIIDMVVASTLMAMGMMMLPPVFVSLPFKIVLFGLVDGWFLLTGSLVRSFTG